ncbi:MAG: glycosyltransferase [Patescibacteria group bacterium]
MPPEFTIVIPAKNEEHYIGKLLESIRDQDYQNIKDVPIFVADAESTDHTRAVVETFSNILNIAIIKGGPVAVGRNNGAEYANTKYLLFIDADVELKDKTILRRTIEIMEKKKLHCVGAYIQCSNGTIPDHFTYFLNNLVQFFARFSSPFAVGAFMCIRKDIFETLGKFNTNIHFAEDYFLSKDISPRKFRIIGSVFTDNRRFKKVGHWNMVKKFVRVALNAKNQSYFFKHKPEDYWD